MEWSQLSAQVIESSLFLRVLFGKEQLVLEAKGMGKFPDERIDTNTIEVNLK